MGDKVGPNKQKEDEALRDVLLLGMVQDAFLQWEALRFLEKDSPLWNDLAKRKKYAEVVRDDPELSDRVKEKILKESNKAKVKQYDTLVGHFNIDLGMIRHCKDLHRLRLYVEHARALRISSIRKS